MTLRRCGIADTRVLGAMEAVPREAFVPRHLAQVAYENVALPIAGGQTISQPFVVAYMTARLGLGPRMRVLEIGTGSGYQTAVLARLARRVYTIERRRGLLAEAEARFTRLGLSNVVTRLGDGSRGWPAQAPFDRILVTAATAVVPPALVDQIAPEGAMILPLGEDPDDQRLVLLRRRGDAVVSEPLIAVRFVPLVSGRTVG